MAMGRAPIVNTSRSIPPHAGRSPLIGFDVGGMVVRFHFENRSQPVADIDDARILPRPADDVGGCRRQNTQPFARGLIRAMLAPHDGENAQFRESGFAAQNGENFSVFLRRQTMFGDRLGGDAKSIFCLGGRRGGSFHTPVR